MGHLAQFLYLLILMPNNLEIKIGHRPLNSLGSLPSLWAFNLRMPNSYVGCPFDELMHRGLPCG